MKVHGIVILVISVALLGLVGCDEQVVRFDPGTAPRADGGGLHIALEHFRGDSTSVRAWMSVTNTTGEPIEMDVPPGMAFWATAVSGDRHATVRAIRWSDHNDYEDFGGASADDIPGSWIFPEHATQEIELILTVPHALPSNREPWTVTIHGSGSATMAIPLVDPQMASAAAPTHQP